jgi:cellulose synthase/poly-beta-1,6-N-acetylglucosamine synthase-like glycosyltransferase
LSSPFIFFLSCSSFPVPAKAFKTNTKYCSIIPETKHPRADWLDVTIQIPVYKEGMVDVLMPTLRSCIVARDHYNRYTHGTARCNIVMCDDGMMAYLNNNFPAAEMLWNTIRQTNGRLVRLSQLLKHVDRTSRMHLKGLRSKHVYEVFHRMLYFYHHDIGFVARSTIDRRGKFKKASNLNAHLRLALGAAQRSEHDPDISFNEAMLDEVHNEDGSRETMFGNDVRVGDLICINDADARMAETVIHKTVPEFLNDKSLGFTQHATKTMTEQRGESYFTNMLAVFTDGLYHGHFLLSSILGTHVGAPKFCAILAALFSTSCHENAVKNNLLGVLLLVFFCFLGCHPPLVGHSIFLRVAALKQCGRVRGLRAAQQWLTRIGLHFLPVDQVGFANLEAQNRTEYWSESHVSEDFELMIQLYSLGFNGRYCAYPDCEFQEGITRTFDEEAGRHRKFALGAHELVFNTFESMPSQGVFTPVFKTFMSCGIPNYYKVFLSAYLCSYASGSTYIIVFTVSAIMRILDRDQEVDAISLFNPAGVILLNFVVYYFLGYITFLVAMSRMRAVNQNLLFPEYRKKWCGGLYLVFVKLRYSFLFQFLFYNVATFTFYFMGACDHLLGRQAIVGATNKDLISVGRCSALWETIRFNSGSWCICLFMVVLAYTTVVQEADWDITDYPNTKNEYLQHALFAGPAFLLALFAFVVPLILNPYILGWPFLRKKKQPKKDVFKSRKIAQPPTKTVDIPTLMKMQSKANKTGTTVEEAIMKTKDDLDNEVGSFTTSDLRTQAGQDTPYRKKSVLRLNPALLEEKEIEYNQGNANVPNITNASQNRSSRPSSLEQNRGRNGNESFERERRDRFNRSPSLDHEYQPYANERKRATPEHVLNTLLSSHEGRRSDGGSMHRRQSQTRSPGPPNRNTSQSPMRPRSPISPVVHVPQAVARKSAKSVPRSDNWGFPHQMF